MALRILDLFCGAGGCAVGYHRAGFHVVGIDHKKQPHYPFEFHQADALEYLKDHWHEFDLIHASPPCQEWSSLNRIHKRAYPKLIAPIRQFCKTVDKPYVIENGPYAPLEDALLLCGSMFGLSVWRHRLFECSYPIYFAPSPCAHIDKPITVTGHTNSHSLSSAAMGIDWMNCRELAQAIPPDYTEFIGKEMIAALQPALVGARSWQ